VYTYDRIVTKCRVTQVVFYIWLIVSHRTTPYQSIWKSVAVYFRVTNKHPVYPVQILTVVCIGYLCFIYIKRRYCDSTWNVIPFLHYIFVNLSHDKGTTFNEDQTWAGFLLVLCLVLKTTKLCIIILPSGGRRNVGLFTTTA